MRKQPCTSNTFRLAIDAIDFALSEVDDGIRSLRGEATRLPDGRIEFWSHVIDEDLRESLHHLLMGMGVMWKKTESQFYGKRYFLPPDTVRFLQRLVAGLDSGSAHISHAGEKEEEESSSGNSVPVL